MGECFYSDDGLHCYHWPESECCYCDEPPLEPYESEPLHDTREERDGWR